MLFNPTAIFRFRHAEDFARMANFEIRPTIMTSSNEDKKHLRRLGHDLKPVVTIAAKGLTDNVSAELERALSDHELIKVKLAVGDREAKKPSVIKSARTLRQNWCSQSAIYCLSIDQPSLRIPNYPIYCASNPPVKNATTVPMCHNQRH